jgi:hypothetical protein
MTDSALTKQQVAPLAEIGPMQLMQQALASGTSPEVIRELVALQQSVERFTWEREERQSKIDFDNALNECQRQIGRIAPNRERENNITWLDYVGVDKVVRPIYLEAGFSIGFSEVDSPTEGRRMCATLSRSGVSREYFSKLIPSGNGKMSVADLDASGSSRAMRYLLLKIFNIAVGIDKDEKKSFADGTQQSGQVGEARSKELCDHIGLADSMVELGCVYLAAQKEAQYDGVATLKFAEAKRQRQAQLRKEGRA